MQTFFLLAMLFYRSKKVPLPFLFGIFSPIPPNHFRAFRGVCSATSWPSSPELVCLFFVPFAFAPPTFDLALPLPPAFLFIFIAQLPPKVGLQVQLCPLSPLPIPPPPSLRVFVPVVLRSSAPSSVPISSWVSYFFAAAILNSHRGLSVQYKAISSKFIDFIPVNSADFHWQIALLCPF